MTRAEAVTIFARLLKDKVEVPEDTNFTDIDNHWAYYGIIEATHGHEYEKENEKENWDYLWGTSYKFIFYMNDEENKIYESSKSYNIDDSVKLPTKVVSEEDKEFVGWALVGDDEKITRYIVKEKDVNENYKIEFYAMWE